MNPGAVVLSRTGAAVAADFNNATGAPIVGDTDTGMLYWFSNGKSFPIPGYSINVMAKGATGDGITDDTAAIQSALNDASTGGTIFFPYGTYIISSTLIVRGGQNLIGVSRGIYSTISGSVIRSNTVGLKFMQIAVGSIGVSIESLMFWGSDGLALAGTIGLLMEGAAGDSPINAVRVVNSSFWRFEKAIVGRDTVGPTGSFQVSNLRLEDVVLGESKYGLWMESANADYWEVNNCTGSCLSNGSIFYINRGGTLILRNTTGSGQDSTTTAFLTINGVVDCGIRLEICQAESIKYFLNVPADLGLPNTGVLMSGCTINGDIDVAATCNLIFEACDITNPVVIGSGGGSNARVFDIGSVWHLLGALTLNSNSKLVSDIGVARAAEIAQAVAKFQSGFAWRRVPLSQSAAITIETRFGNDFDINVTGGTGFTISNPNVAAGATPPIRIRIKNSSGGPMGLITWDTQYKLAAWTNPADANSRTIDFQFDDTNWIEATRTTADVPN